MQHRPGRAVDDHGHRAARPESDETDEAGNRQGAEDLPARVDVPHRHRATAELAKRRERSDPAPLLAGFLELLGNPPAPVGSDGAVAGEGGPLERHAWITGHWLGLAASITYARGVPVDTVAAAFGDIALGTGPVSLTDTQQVALRREGEWTLAIAFNRRPFAQKVVDALRPHGTVLCVDWETNGNRLVYYAEPGSDVARMRPEHGNAPPSLAPYTASLPALAGNAAPWLLALGEAVTGIAFTPDALDASHTLVGSSPGEAELRPAGKGTARVVRQGTGRYFGLDVRSVAVRARRRDS